MNREIRDELNRGRKLTAEKITMIEKARGLPETYDAENPPIDPAETPEQYAALMQAVAARNRRTADRLNGPSAAG